jgi:hypothetical protein
MRGDTRLPGTLNCQRAERAIAVIKQLMSLYIMLATWERPRQAKNGASRDTQFWPIHSQGAPKREYN